MPSTFSLPKTALSTRFRSGGSEATDAAEGNRRTKRGDLPLIPGHDGDLSGQIERLHQSGRANLGHLGVVGLEQGHPRDIFGRAVAVVSDDGDLLLGAPLHDAAGRLALDFDDRRVGVAAVGSALLDPAIEHAIFVASHIHPLPAAMRVAAAGLQEQQAFAGRRGEQAATTALFDEELVVVLRIETEQREFEAVLSARLAVTAAAVAAELGEDRHDLVLVAAPL